MIKTCTFPVYKEILHGRQLSVNNFSLRPAKFEIVFEFLA